jgi:membrane-associated phospholipid phosphatase
MGALVIPQRMHTVPVALDYLTDYEEWLAVQDGFVPGPYTLDPVPRYIRNLRDLAEWVHVDALYQAYHQACLILLGLGAPFDAGNPYTAGKNQSGFGTFGGPHILSLVTEVATRALKAVWYQKWFVHRRLRPEAFGGLVHHALSGSAAYPVHPEILGSAGVDEVFARHGSYLLPVAMPEGCPTHPSYGSGHATVAGACVTILKAWFDESFVIPGPVVPDPSGTSLVPYQGPPLTVGNELDKLAANVAAGRNALGIHYRSDYFDAVRLGEAVALGILEEQKATYNEDAAFTLTTFDGKRVTI